MRHTRSLERNAPAGAAGNIVGERRLSSAVAPGTGLAESLVVFVQAGDHIRQVIYEPPGLVVPKAHQEPGQCRRMPVAHLGESRLGPVRKGDAYAAPVLLVVLALCEPSVVECCSWLTNKGARWPT